MPSVAKVLTANVSWLINYLFEVENLGKCDFSLNSPVNRLLFKVLSNLPQWWAQQECKQEWDCQKRIQINLSGWMFRIQSPLVWWKKRECSQVTDVAAVTASQSILGLYPRAGQPCLSRNLALTQPSISGQNDAGSTAMIEVALLEYRCRPPSNT